MSKWLWSLRNTQRVLVPQAGTVGCMFRRPGVATTVYRPIRSLSLTQSRPSLAATHVKEAEWEPESSTMGAAFDSLREKISKETLRAITKGPLRLTNMTAVQEAVLPLLPGLAEPYDPKTENSTEARDLLVRAKTGTGKTLAFLVPAIESRINALKKLGENAVAEAGQASSSSLRSRAIRAYAKSHVGTLIVSPTRELATQIVNEAQKLTAHHEGFEVHTLVGGMSKGAQLRQWRYGSKDIVVGTPGRILDLINSEPDVAECMKTAQVLVLDEADTLLDMGFRDDIEMIIKSLPRTPQRQTFLFSATVNARVEQVARASLNKKHIFINTVSHETSPVHAHVPQFHTVVPSAADQLPHILRLIAHDQLANPGISKIILFLPTTKMTMLYGTLLNELSSAVLPAGKGTSIIEIHSKRNQSSRTKASDIFRRSKRGATILVTSDVSARGVDYPGVTRVIQVGIPSSAEQYVHRVGRTGRTGSNVGRGDLVLLPWETRFVTRELGDVPIKPVTYEQIKKQTEEFAARFDEDPELAFENVPVPEGNRFTRTAEPVKYRGPVLPKVNAIDEEVKQLLSSADEEAMTETMMSLLGYYLSRTTELGIRKEAVVEECKAWAVGAGGLSEAPHVSAHFLERMGISKETSDRSKPRFGIRKGSWDDAGNNRRFDRKSGRRSFDFYEDEGSGFGKKKPEGSRGRGFSGGFNRDRRDSGFAWESDNSRSRRSGHSDSRF